MVVCDERVPEHESPEPSLPASLPVSFPLSVFKDLKTSSSNELGRRLQMLSFPPSCVIASLIPLTLCTMQVQDVMKPIVLMSVVVKDEMVWAVRILNSTFDVNNFPMVNNIPPKLFSVSDVLNLVNVLDLSKLYIGNPDFSMVEHWHQKRYNLHSYNGDRVGYMDDTLLTQTPPIRHRDCCLLLQQDATSHALLTLFNISSTLYIQSIQKGHGDEGSSSTVNYRFLQLPELVERLGRLHGSYRSLLKSAERLRKRVEEETMKSAVVLDDEPETYIRDTISSPEAEEYFKNLRPDSFQHIFWQQQVEAASKS